MMITGSRGKRSFDLFQECETRLPGHPDVRDHHAGSRPAASACWTSGPRRTIRTECRPVRALSRGPSESSDRRRRSIRVSSRRSRRLKCNGRTKWRKGRQFGLIAIRLCSRGHDSPGGPALLPGLEREQHGEHGTSRHAFALDRAGVLRDERLRQRKPEAAAALAAGDERIEDAVAYRLGYARSVVLDREREREATAHSRQRHVARDARGEANPRVNRRRSRPAPRCGRY